MGGCVQFNLMHFQHIVHEIGSRNWLSHFMLMHVTYAREHQNLKGDDIVLFFLQLSLLLTHPSWYLVSVDNSVLIQHPWQPPNRLIKPHRFFDAVPDQLHVLQVLPGWVLPLRDYRLDLSVQPLLDLGMLRQLK